MSKEINDETLKEFIQNHLSVTDFGYLVIPNDARLNDEALSNIKQSFKDFVAQES